jgi:hypothetical protein
MSAAFDYVAHYKAVRARLNRPRPTAPAPLFLVLYDEPIGPQFPVWYLALKGAVPSVPEVTSTPRHIARAIVAEVCLKHNTHPDEVMSDRRKGTIIPARYELFYRLCKETTWSLPRIGAFVRRDHTTVMYGYRKHAQRNGLPL